MRRKLLLIPALFCGWQSVGSAEDLSYLQVVLNDESVISFLLDENPVITFSKEALIVNGDENTTYEFSNFNYYRLSDKLVCNLPSVKRNEVVVSQSVDGTVSFKGLDAKATLSLYNVAGVLISKVNACADGSAQVELPVQKGVYIISDGKYSFKVIRK